jgi:transposase InsO family protein
VLQIKVAHRQGRKTYGSPRVHRVLRDQKVRVGRKRIARLMREAGLRGVCRGRVKPRTTQSNPHWPVAANLLERCFAPAQIGGLNRVLCGDITYVATAQGWLYLATVQDLFSRRIVGWALSQSLEAEIVQEAFERAMQTRESDGQTYQRQFKLFHSDRGSQYASWLFKKVLKKHGFVASMSRKGDCWDNAVAESFFGTYKSELVEQQPGGRFASKAQAYDLTADYIENFYNRVRLHSTLDYRSPVAFELAHQAGMLSAF